MVATSDRPEGLNRLRRGPGDSTALLASNQRSMNLLGDGTESTADTKGRVIRQHRLAQNMDPALLAAQACISLIQLYEIETGQSAHFHSRSIMERTARRVALLLGLDWDAL